VDSRIVRDELHIGFDKRVLVAGSTHHGEDDLLLEIYYGLRKYYTDLRLVLVPRHLERISEIERACQKRALVPIRKTRLNPERREIGAHEIMLLDTIGELERVCSAGDMVFVGGSLVNVGGHNMLEPAGKGKAVLYGP